MTKGNEHRNISVEDDRLKSALTLIRDKASQLWERPLMRHYTEHGIKHSENIIKIMDKLIDTRVGLNDDEAFVLLAATYLHDIGMQQSNQEELDCGQVQRTLEEMDIIRKNHNDLSYDMIIDSVNNKLICHSLALENFRDYVDNIACLVKYHRKYDLRELSDDSYKGKKIRIPLLAALLRLGDELDADCDRVNIEQLKYDNIPTESKFHWWCCLYVKSIDINEGKVKVIFRFPSKYIGNDILTLLQKRVIDSFQKQLDQVYDLLDNYGLRLYRKVLWDIQYSSVVEEIPDDLLGFLKKKTIKK